MQLSDVEWARLCDVGDGISNAERFMELLTDFHGGSVKTEYLLSVEIARALLQRTQPQVVLEYLGNQIERHLLVSDRSKSWSLGSQRFDVAVVAQTLAPDFLVEAKIRVVSLTGQIAQDLAKMIAFLSYLKPAFARTALGTSVFQVHVDVRYELGELEMLPGRKRRTRQKFPRRACVAQTTQQVRDIEAKLKSELVGIAARHPGFEFAWVEFQGPDDRIHDDEIEADGDGPGQAYGRPGFACRYYGILVRRLDDPSAPGRAFGSLFVHRDAPARLVVEDALAR